MESVIELHDSEVVAILELGTQIVILLRAYLHMSEGSAGRDAGSGWVQAIALTFVDGAIEGDLPDLPTLIYKGDMILDGEVWRNTIPIRPSYVGEVALKLLVDFTQPLVISGKGIDLTLIGEAVYIEEYSGAPNPERHNLE